MGDGRLGKCKDCTKVDVQENRRAKRGYYDAYDRARYHESKPARMAIIEAAREKYPEKAKARWTLHNAVKRGRLAKPSTCQHCSVVGRIEGHHQDYSKPLDVMWLCKPCHGKQHWRESF